MKLMKLSLALLFVIAPVITLASQKAKTLDEFVKMFDSSRCKGCHAQIYEDWEKSMHAQSLFNTRGTVGGYKRMIEGYLMEAWGKSGVKTVKDIKVEHFAQCFKCHLPHFNKDTVTDDIARELAEALVKQDAATVKKVGITCIVCHNTKAIIYGWQDGKPEKNVIYGSKDGSHPDAIYKTMKKVVTMGEAVACGQCHGTGPNFEFPHASQCATAYGSYLHAYIPAGGSKTCQDCHMKDSNKGHRMPAYRDPDMAKMAVDMNVDITKAGDRAVVTVKITNKAGHRIPDGCPSQQRIVMDVTAKTKDGKEVFKDSKIFMTPNDRSFKVGYVRDTSLQPLQTVVEKYEIMFPHEDKEGEGAIKAKEMDVTVEFRYQAGPAVGEIGKDSFICCKETRIIKNQ